MKWKYLYCGNCDKRFAIPFEYFSWYRKHHVQISIFDYRHPFQILAQYRCCEKPFILFEWKLRESSGMEWKPKIRSRPVYISIHKIIGYAL